MRSIGTKFSVAAGFLALVFAGLLMFRTYTSARDHMAELATTQARLALEFDLAIRNYVANSIRPEMQKRIGRDEFVLKAMSTSYVAREIFDEVRKSFSDYVIKFSAENPRNPGNLPAGEGEVELLRLFAERPDIQEWSGQITLRGVRYYAHASPMRIEFECLKCHGKPEDAPQSLLADYGREAGFGKRLGEVAGMDLVAIPVSRVEEVLAHQVLGDLGITGLWLLLLFAGILLVFRRLVTRRLAWMNRHFQLAAVEQGGLVAVSPLVLRGRDEIGLLAASFNGLMGRLRDLQLTLEERVRHRTEQLSQANADLAEAKEAAEVSSRAKGQFLANVSHEIRTPMTAVLGMNELMLASKLDAEQREYAEAIHQSAETLLSLLNDILDFSKMEADKLDLETIPFAMERCARSVVGIFNPKAAEKGIGLRLEYDATLPSLVRGDPGRCQQVLMNLVSNAVKFTAKGEVVLRLRREAGGRRPGRVLVAVEVQDTGVGMSEEEMSRLLRPFAQADLSTTRRYGGSGLGLVICDKLVALMGGKLTIQSDPGEGTVVRFCVELEEVAGGRVVDMRGTGKAEGVECSCAIPARVAGRSLRVLVVEDTLANQKLLRRLLEKVGHVCELASHGQEAVEAMQRGRYDVVLMDCQMPVMDGFEATRRIREWEHREGVARTPIVALTASAMKGDREACLVAGMDDYLTKPIVMQGLFSMLERLGGGAVERVVAGAELEEPDVAGEPLDLEAVRSMIGDDPEVLRDMLETFLEENRGRLGALRDALGAGDLSGVRLLAHGVKSASLNFHAGSMASVARELESRAKAGGLEGGEQLLLQLEEELRRIEGVGVRSSGVG
ncbi:MAG: hypothetical protein RI897_896 [Verrucomicrobiota bacterium]|jgi:signal transduction histidine kinase/HPt (histidine-containing phosphotransfer) domain-containing protein/AmiR/NasT family two-component response regulator